MKFYRGERELRSLDVLFSHCNVPVGEFAFVHVAEQAPHSLLFINTTRNDWYQCGIPGVTETIDETARCIAAIAEQVGATQLRTIGCSMGAYAALLYGDLLGADQVIACDPELEIGRERMRSWEWNSARVFGEHRNILPAVRRLNGRALISFAIQDPMEAYSARLLLEGGHSPALTKFLHGNPWHIDWRRVFTEPHQPVRPDPRFLVERPSDRTLGEAASLYWDAYGGSARPDATCYVNARAELPSIALYDAILHCQNGDHGKGADAMVRYLIWRRQEGIRETVDPLDDIERRFSFPPPKCCETREFLAAMIKCTHSRPQA